MEQHEQVFPYYRSPDAIRTQQFSTRMRGLDEQEVDEFLDLLADQVQSTEIERSQMLSEITRLRAEVQRLGAHPALPPRTESTPDAAHVLDQAQRVADQVVEEAVRHAREMIETARGQQRQILEEARRASGRLRSVAEALSEQVEALEGVPTQVRETGPPFDPGQDPSHGGLPRQAPRDWLFEQRTRD